MGVQPPLLNPKGFNHRNWGKTIILNGGGFAQGKDRLGEFPSHKLPEAIAPPGQAFLCIHHLPSSFLTKKVANPGIVIIVELQEVPNASFVSGFFRSTVFIII